jgi:hypothetical protein
MIQRVKHIEGLSTSWKLGGKLVQESIEHLSEPKTSAMYAGNKVK